MNIDEEEFNRSCHVIVESLHLVPMEYRNRFFRQLAEKYCLKCGLEYTKIHYMCHCDNDE